MFKLKFIQILMQPRHAISTQQGCLNYDKTTRTNVLVLLPRL